MGNDNSHNKAEPQPEPPTRDIPSASQQPDEEVQEEFHPSLETLPVLYPQWDTNGQQAAPQQRVESNFPSLFSDDLTEPALSGSHGDVSLQRGVWEEGQLLPALPQTELYIERQEYKESGSSSQPGTIREETNEEDIFGEPEDIGLIGILREWGQQVKPEKIVREKEEDRKDTVWMPYTEPSPEETSLIGDFHGVQAQEKKAECADLPGIKHITASIADSSITSFNANDTLDYGSWNLGEPNIQLVTGTLQQISAPLQIFSRNEEPVQPDTIPKNLNILSKQEKGESMDNITAQTEQKQLCGFYDAKDLNTDGANIQTGIQGNLILPLTTIGNSDSNKEKLGTTCKPEPDSLVYSGVVPIVQVFDRSPIVLEQSSTDCNLYQTAGAGLLAQMGKKTSDHSFPGIQSEDFDSDTKKCPNDLNNKADQTEKNLTENIQSEIKNYSKEIPRKDSVDFSSKNVKDGGANMELKVDELKVIVKNTNPSDLLSPTSGQFPKGHEGSKSPNAGNGTTATLYNINSDPGQQISIVPPMDLVSDKHSIILNDHTGFKKSQPCQETAVDIFSAPANKIVPSENVDILQKPLTDKVMNQAYDIAQMTKDNKPQSCINNLLLEDVPTFSLNTLELHLAEPCPDLQDDITKKSQYGHYKALRDQSSSENRVTPIPNEKIVDQNEVEFQLSSLSGNKPSSTGNEQVPGEDDFIWNVENYMQSNANEKFENYSVSSATYLRKAAETDIETTNLSVSVCPGDMGYSPSIQASQDLPTQPLNTLEIFSKEEVCLLPPNLYPPFFKTGSAMDYKYMVSPKGEQTNSLNESSNILSTEAMTEVSQDQSGLDMSVNPAHQRQSYDIDCKLQSHFLTDLDRHNLKPDYTLKEPSKVQLLENASAFTEEDSKGVNDKPNLGSRSTKSEDVPSLILSQQQEASSKDTPCLISDILPCLDVTGSLSEDGVLTSRTPDLAIACISASPVIIDKMDETLFTTGDKDVAELQGSNALLSTESNVFNYVKEENQLPGSKTEGQRIKSLELSAGTNKADTGIPTAHFGIPADTGIPTAHFGIPADTGIPTAHFGIPADAFNQLQMPADTDIPMKMPSSNNNILVEDANVVTASVPYQNVCEKTDEETPAPGIAMESEAIQILTLEAQGKSFQSQQEMSSVPLPLSDTKQKELTVICQEGSTKVCAEVKTDSVKPSNDYIHMDNSTEELPSHLYQVGVDKTVTPLPGLASESKAMLIPTVDASHQNFLAKQEMSPVSLTPGNNGENATPDIHPEDPTKVCAENKMESVMSNNDDISNDVITSPLYQDGYNKTGEETLISGLALESKVKQTATLITPEKNKSQQLLQRVLPPIDNAQTVTPITSICPESKTKVYAENQIESIKHDAIDNSSSKDVVQNLQIANNDQLQELSIGVTVSLDIESVIDDPQMSAQNINTFKLAPLLGDIEKGSSEETVGKFSYIDQAMDILSDERSSGGENQENREDLKSLVGGDPASGLFPVLTAVSAEGSQHAKTEFHKPMESQVNTTEYPQDETNVNLESSKTAYPFVYNDQKAGSQTSKIDGGIAEVCEDKSQYAEPVKSKSELSESSHAHSVKAEEALNSRHHNTLEEIHPQETHPEMRFEGVLHIRPDEEGAIIRSEKEHTSIHTDDVGSFTANKGKASGGTALEDTLSVMNDVSSQVNCKLDVGPNNQCLSKQYSAPVTLEKTVYGGELGLSLGQPTKLDLGVENSHSEQDKTCDTTTALTLPSDVQCQEDISPETPCLLPEKKDETFVDSTVSLQISDAFVSNDQKELNGKDFKNTDAVAEDSHSTVTGVEGSHSTVTGVDGSHSTVTGVEGSHSTVTGVDGSHSTVTGVEGSHSTVTGVEGSHSTVSGVDGSHSTVRGEDGSHSTVRGEDGSHSTVRGEDGSHSTVTGVDVSHSTVTGVDGSHSTVTGVDGSHSTVTGVDGSHSTVTGVDGSHSTVTEVDGSHSTVTGVDGSHSTVTGVDGSHSTVTGVDGSHSTVTGVDVSHSTVTGVDGSHSTVTGVDGSHSTVTGVDGSHSTVTGVDGSHSTVTEVDGSHSTVTGVDGSHSTVTGVDGSHSTVSGKDGSHSTVRGEDGSHLTVTGVDYVLEVKETAITSDDLDLIQKESDILSDLPCSAVKETEILSDEPLLTENKTNNASQQISPPCDDSATSALAVTPMEGISMQEKYIVHETCGSSVADPKSIQTKPESEELLTYRIDTAIENKQDSSMVPVPLTAPDTDISRSELSSASSCQETPPAEPVPSLPAIRSPTFPPTDSLSFTQKLRSVLHSERPFPKKTMTPTSSEPLVLPSSPRLRKEGAVNERSSDSEEAFETPESTTPVKSAPPIPIPDLPEVQEQQPQQRQDLEEVLPPPPKPEEPAPEQSLENTQAPEPKPAENENINDSPFRQPSRSFSVVFDEDKPIASSGTYNLDIVVVNTVDVSSASSESSCKTRRKSTDSVPTNRNTLSRSLSLQAGDFQFDDVLSGQGGSESVFNSLRRPKKVRPTSLKKKAASAKKQTEAVSNKDTQALSAEPQEAEESNDLQIQSVPSPPPTDKELPLLGEQETQPVASLEVTSVDPQLSSITSTPLVDSCPLPLTGRVSPPLPTHQKREVTPGDSGVPENPPVVGQSVRLEFDYSEEAREGQPPVRKGKKPSGKMPLRKPKPKKAIEKPDAPPGPPSSISTDLDDIPIAKGSYSYNLDQWDDPNFNPFSSNMKLPDLPPTTQELPEPFKPIVQRSESPAKTPASFEIPTNDADQIGESNKPAKKKKTPLKTDTFRVKKSPKRSPVTENGSEELTILSKSDTPPVIASEDHATDEEKLASSVVSQKWTCMAVDLEPDKQDYPQPSDLTSFVNETQFHSSTDDIDYGSSFNIEYMEKTGKCSPLREVPQPQSLYLMFEASQDSPENSPAKFSESCTPGTDFETMESNICSGQLPLSRSPPIMQDSTRQASERSRSRDDEPELIGSGKMELGSPDDEYMPSEALLSRIAHHNTLCDQLSYLEPDLAEKNPQAFAQKLQQEELEFEAMRIEALKLAKHVSQSSQYTEEDGAAASKEDPEILDPNDVGLSHKSLYSRSVAMETAGGGHLHNYQQSDLEAALQLAREEITAKEREVTDWKKKYEDTRCEVVEMRKIVAEYEQTIAQMIGSPEDDQREKSMSHHTVQQLIIEKEQALSDLNSVEKSLAELFRRYEKMKDVLEGFRKNEEVLKKCAQEYLARVKKEEQRYHALKIHAEEKLDRANSDIAQVRTKSLQEQAAYQASLRKEQLRVDALERTLEQKNKEIEELTKICDELISKMGKS
ncbi:transforming acidic coiled-coil-containing protein 2 isoform X2 [Rana temporaria]|uniref:transforming acidic coiled-coil-containing protein 2 isoform X2 n=1 Tax=Rana temporaria TaxID=8407 RepID=UPI001AAC5364|nr:transforming acidic coiled-coil-containing protein 2 isoform X2 [Rana temporaria]